MNDLERAIVLATEAHAGQIDKAGAPYILHPLRVMLRVNGDAQRIAAVLHDVVEDTSVTLDELRERGFSEEVLAAIEALTKQPDEESEGAYFAFIERAGRNSVARPVKLADIEDNLDLSRIPTPTEKDIQRLARYQRARNLLHLIAREQGERTIQAPTIMPLRNVITREEVEAECPGSRPILVCDFYCDGAEQGTIEPGGLRLGRILNVDHHAPLPEMGRPITSTQLAYEHLRARAAALADPPAPWVAINHTDCDSVLSSAMLMGYLKPDEELVRASICADHTGEPHPVADLLQALDEGRQGDRTEAQYLESLRNLRLFLAGEELEPAAREALDRRRQRQIAARLVVESGEFNVDGPLAWASLDEEIDGALFPALLPEAVVIMLASRHPTFPGRWAVKLRLGQAAPPELTLHSLAIREWDPNFGGRWNAGSSKRGGGTTMDPNAYAERLRQRLVEQLASLSRARESRPMTSPVRPSPFSPPAH